MAALRCWRSPGLLIRSPGRSRSWSRWRRPTCCSLTVRFVAVGRDVRRGPAVRAGERCRRGGGLTWRRSRSQVAGPTGGGRDRCGRPAGRLCRARGRQRVRAGRGTRRSRPPAARAEPAARRPDRADPGQERRDPAGRMGAGDRGGPRRAQAGTAPGAWEPRRSTTAHRTGHRSCGGKPGAPAQM
jgi:hypothetical protein